VPSDRVFVTGNPVVDSLQAMLAHSCPTPALAALLLATKSFKRIVLTTHRRESFGATMCGNLAVLRAFVERYTDVALFFPVHPNPAVVDAGKSILAQHPRIHLLPPMTYDDFVALLSHAWLIVSDSGGIQEEAPTLHKPLLILRENTERPEAVDSGVARLVGGRPERLAAMLEEVHQDGAWLRQVANGDNPFGRGDSGRRIVQTILEVLAKRGA
jgi:UDP-N-acetylglucosamine 2-epimerase (non-hydrolysing)